MASSSSVVRIAPSQKWRREWYYLDYDAYECDHVHRDWMLYGESKTKQDYVPVKCTDCSNDVMFADFDKHRRTCCNKLQGCEWAELCKEHLKHLNTSADECNWLDGCEYAKINCVYCNLCEPAERREIKGRLEKRLEERDFRLVLAMTWDARSKWYNLGLGLGVSAETLDVIRQKDQDDAEKCFIDMIIRWIKSDDVGDKSFKAISRALASVSVGRQRVAEDMEKSVLCRNVFKTEAERLHRQVEQKLEELGKQINEYTALTENYEKKTKELKKSKKELREYRADWDKQSEQIKDLKKRYKRENLELDDTERDIKLFRKDFDDYSQQLNDLQEDLVDQQDTIPPEIKEAISHCCERMNECSEQISKLKEDITQSEMELKQIKEKISICERNIVHAIDELKILKQNIKISKKRLEREKESNIVRDANSRDLSIDQWLGKIFEGAGFIGLTAGLIAFFTAPIMPAVAAVGSMVFLGSWLTGFSAGTVSLIRQSFLGPLDKYNEEQCRVRDGYDKTISKISLAADKLRDKYVSCEKILETKREIINEFIVESASDTW